MTLTFDQLFYLVTQHWTPLHAHPEEDVATPGHSTAISAYVGFWQRFIDPPNIGMVEHAAKVYPPEVVLPSLISEIIDQIMKNELNYTDLNMCLADFFALCIKLEGVFVILHGKEFATYPDAIQRWKTGTWNFGYHEEIYGTVRTHIGEAFFKVLETYARRFRYHTVDQLVQSQRTFKAYTQHRGLFGLEVDAGVTINPDGTLNVNFVPTLDTIASRMVLDFLVLSIHPGTAIVDDAVCKNPQLILEAYLGMMRLFKRTAPTQFHSIPVILGHPFRKMPGFSRMNTRQLGEFVRAAKRLGFIIEISANDYMHQLHNDQGARKSGQGPAEMTKTIATLYPELLRQIVAQQAQVTVDTDWHVGNYLRSLQLTWNKVQSEPGPMPQKDQDRADAWQWYSSGSFGPPAHLIRGTMIRFVQVIEYLLAQGVQIDQIVNLTGRF